MSNHVLQGPWRPKSYPSQSCPEQASRYDPTVWPEPERVPKLPTTIRAVQDSRCIYSGGRTLVICLDGTGDKFDNDNSNVVNFVACLKKDDPSQVTYYQSGIGTYDGHGLKKGFSAGIDMAVGSGLGIHIKDAYRFLMQNYHEGDKICLLGFSRGSYTVRCLAGMLQKVGLLPAHNQAQVSFAYAFYKNDTPQGRTMSAEFKKTFCNDVQVYFVGVFDCVASVGFIPRKLPFSKSPNYTLKYFRHAMALDEHRAKFEVCSWTHQDDDAESLENNPRGKVKAKKHGQLGGIRGIFSSYFGSQRRISAKDTVSRQSSTSSTSQLKKFEYESDQDKSEWQFLKNDQSMDEHSVTDVLEVWFAGAHADVGGGAVPNGERHMLSRIPLRWMIRQCFECNTGILFGTAALAEAGIDVPTLWPVYKMPKKPVVGPSPDLFEQYEAGALPPLRRRSTALGVDRDKKVQSEGEGEKEIIPNRVFKELEKRRSKVDLLPEHVEDHFDAMAPINDQLKQAKGWWILEFWPVKLHVLTKSEQWKKVVGMNLGRYRPIRETEPQMHWTVQMRMDDKAYKIRNRVDKNVLWQVAT